MHETQNYAALYKLIYGNDSPVDHYSYEILNIKFFIVSLVLC